MLEKRPEPAEEIESPKDKRPAAAEEADQTSQRSAQVISRSLAEEQFGDSGLSPGQVRRAMQRNPYWCDQLGIRPTSFGTRASPSTAEFAHAVARYQRGHGLTVDGIAGPRTHHSLMADQLEGRSTSDEEIPGVLGEKDIRAARRAAAIKKATKNKEQLEPGVLSEKDVLEPGVLGEKDVLEPGVLSEKDVMEPGVLGEPEAGVTKPKKAPAKKAPANKAPANKNPDVLEPGVLGEKDVLEPGVLGEKDVLEPGVLSEKDVMEPGVLGEPEAPSIKKRADELE